MGHFMSPAEHHSMMWNEENTSDTAQTPDTEHGAEIMIHNVSNVIIIISSTTKQQVKKLL